MFNGRECIPRFSDMAVCIPYNPENKPWAYFRSKHFFLGLFSGGFIFGGAYFRDEIRVRKGGGLIIEGYISATITKTKRIISL